MTVVSDTSPFRYLILIDAIEVVPKLFGPVHAPPEVVRELQRSKNPELGLVRRWANSPPGWLTERAPARIDQSLPKKLGRGEVEAISLAQELRAERTFIDDKDARKAAKERGLPLAGTLSILEEAACRGLLDIEQAIAKLRQTNFRATGTQYRETIERVRELGSRQ